MDIASLDRGVARNQLVDGTGWLLNLPKTEDRGQRRSTMQTLLKSSPWAASHYGTRRVFAVESHERRHFDGQEKSQREVEL